MKTKIHKKNGTKIVAVKISVDVVMVVVAAMYINPMSIVLKSRPSACCVAAI